MLSKNSLAARRFCSTLLQLPPIFCTDPQEYEACGLGTVEVNAPVLPVHR